MKNLDKEDMINRFSRLVGGNDLASSVTIYPLSFDEKNFVTDYLDKWNACTYITGDNPIFVAAKPQIAALMGMTVKELDDLLATCKY